MFREQVYVFYWVIFGISAWAMVFSWLALLVSRSRMWMVLTLSKTALCFIIGGLVIQRSPLSTPEINAAVVWFQRGALALASVGSVILVYYMLTLANGRMASVRKAFLFPWRPARWLQQRLQAAIDCDRLTRSYDESTD